MTFHTSGLSAFDLELCRRSFQLLALAWLDIRFLTGINPFLPVLMNSTAEVVAVADLCSDVWIDPRFRFLTWFGSADMK